jgi:hypothetical protein
MYKTRKINCFPLELLSYRPIKSNTLSSAALITLTVSVEKLLNREMYYDQN